MRNNGRGGMQTNSAKFGLICPKCGKPAARLDILPDRRRYMHFTKKGVVWHEIPMKKGKD